MDSNAWLDPELQRQLAEVFRGEARERVENLRQILATLATKPPAPDALLQQAKREAHNLKGSAATVGVESLSTLAQKLERQVQTLMGSDTAPSAIAVAAMRITVEELARLVEAAAA